MAEVAELLAREAGLLSQFIAALGEEQDALKQGATAPLAGLTQRKGELAQRLNAAEGERHAVLRQAGLSQDRRGMAAWVEQNPGNPGVAMAWDNLLRLAAHARDLNRLNGQLIALRLNATNQALEALTVQAREKGLYGRDGQATQLTGSRIIDSA